MAIHVIQGSGPPTEAPQEKGMHYIDNTNKKHYLANGNESVDDWQEVPGEGGSGSSTFIGLSDTPANYSGSANKELAVNVDADAIIFKDRRFTDNVDTPAGYAGDGGKQVVVKSDETGLEFVPQGSGSLPAGGDEDDILTKNSDVDQDASFKPLSDQPDFQDHESRITQNTDDILDRVEWKNEWAAGTYDRNDMVRDNEWTMIANKQTSDKAGVNEDGQPTYTIEEDVEFAKETDTPISSTGIIVTFTDLVRVTALRYYIPSSDLDVDYTLIGKDVSDENNEEIIFISEIPATTEGWYEVDFAEERIYSAGDKIELELVAVKTGSDTEWDRQWTLAATSSGDPGNRFWRKNSANDEIAISKQDWTLGDATADLASLKPGDTIRFQEAAASGRFFKYQIRSSTDQGSYYEFDVEVVDEGQTIRNNQLCDANAVVHGVTENAPLVEDEDYYATDNTAYNGRATVEGFRRTNLEAPIVGTNNAYGVDIEGVGLVKSPDWDIVAYSGGSGGITVSGITTIKQNQTVWVDTAEGDDTLDENRGNVDKPFKTIKAATDYVTTQNPTDGNDWVIQVNPGVYVELPIVMPRNTQIRGTSDFKTNIFPVLDNQPLITVNIFCNLANLNLDGRVQVIGNNLQENAIFIPFSAGNTFEKLLINNFRNGVTIVTGSGQGNIDSNWVGISIGQLGPVTTPITLLAQTNANMNNFFAEAESTASFDLRDGTSLTINGGFIANASVVAEMDSGSQLTLYGFDLIDIGKLANIDGAVFLKHDGGQLSGNGTDNLIDMTGFGADIQIDGISASGFNRIVNVIDGAASIFISDCVFFTAGDNSVGIRLRGFPNVQVKDCTFFSSSLTGTLAIDSGDGDAPFLDVYNSLFFNYATSIRQGGASGQLTVRDSTFEIFGPPNEAQIGIVMEENAGAFIQDALFVNIGTGCVTDDNAVVNMDGVRFVFSVSDFEQKGNSQIRLNSSIFDEDKIKAENWARIRGTFLSRKLADEAFSIPDKLKVGIPELGETSSFGQGAAYTRGILCYTYDSVADEFEDVSQEAQDAGAGTVEFSNTAPNSAIYISHELTDLTGDPFPFSGVWMNITTFGDVGEGEIISEIWNGSSWQEINDMLTQADAPYNQIPRGDTVNIPQGAYNFRFDDRIETIWETSDPVGRGEESYWYRLRIASNWFDQAWNFRTNIQAQAIAISGAHVNIPLMFDLSRLDDTFWDNVNDDGSDIRICDETGVNQLPVEVSTINTTAKTGRIWFSSDDINAAENKDYYIYYGNADAVTPLPTSQFGESQVWKDYIAVYHFNEPNTANGEVTLDSAKNVKIINGTFEGNSITAQTDGQLDNFYDFNGVDTDSINIGADPSIVAPTGALSMQCLFRDPGGKNKRRLVSIASNDTGDNDEDNFGLYINQDRVFGSITSSNIIDSGVVVNNDQWRSCTLVTDQNIGGLYVDGGLVGTTVNIGGLTPSSFPARIGNRGSLAGSFSFDGGIDEVRFINEIIFPDRMTTETTNIFFQEIFFNILATQTKEQAEEEDGGDPIVSSPVIDQIKIHPLGFTEMGEDGFTQWFGSARPILPLMIDLHSFDYTPATGNPPTEASELWLTQTSGQLGNYYFNQGTRTTMTTVKNLRTELDTSSPIRVGIYFAGLNVQGGSILFRGVLAFSDTNTVLFPDNLNAPSTVPKQEEGLGLVEVEANRVGQTEYVVIEIPMPEWDTQQTYDTRSDLAWLSIERAGDSSLDDYSGPIKILSVQVLGTVWRNGSHVGILGDGPPPGLPGSGEALSPPNIEDLESEGELAQRTTLRVQAATE